MIASPGKGFLDSGLSFLTCSDGWFSLLLQMSKEATLSDAIEHIKNLQNEVLELQRQLGDSPGEAWEKQGSASCSESFVPTENAHYQVAAAVLK